MWTFRVWETNSDRYINMRRLHGSDRQGKGGFPKQTGILFEPAEGEMKGGLEARGFSCGEKVHAEEALGFSPGSCACKKAPG